MERRIKSSSAAQIVGVAMFSTARRGRSPEGSEDGAGAR